MSGYTAKMIVYKTTPLTISIAQRRTGRGQSGKLSLTLKQLTKTSNKCATACSLVVSTFRLDMEILVDRVKTGVWILVAPTGEATVVSRA
ncbi:hypothetical protein RRG08_044342 [Elysia crispata]|uniref:Uncharacterized protein n=1 Tax=Elysia crispata TaxID=231223 RepID=A0AAE1A8M1_9GAST|nr:hypothetical protein RRG08_044342 [Elysia crispata]